MVGSTALSGTVDPELLGNLIRRYQDAAAGAIGRFGGFVAKFMGDGVLAYFGFPRAFEDAANAPFAPRSASWRKSATSSSLTGREFRRGSASPRVSS
jgi:class 3 adenylate cyclase